MRFPSWPFYNVFWLSNASAILNLQPPPSYDDDEDDIANLWYPPGVSHVCPRDIVQGTFLGMGNQMRNGAISGRLERGLGFGQVMDY
jgi:hypothetical protein